MITLYLETSRLPQVTFYCVIRLLVSDEPLVFVIRHAQMTSAVSSHWLLRYLFRTL